MAFAQGSRSSLSFIVESTFGTTPSGNFINLPFTTNSMNLTKDRVEGNDIQADRMPRVDRHGNRQVGGDIVSDLRDSDFDVFLEAAMLNTWSTNVLKVGVTPKFFSLQDYAADIDLARRFTGMYSVNDGYLSCSKPNGNDYLWYCRQRHEPNDHCWFFCNW